VNFWKWNDADIQNAMMLIAIDIGNSTIGAGFFTADGIQVLHMDTRPYEVSSSYCGRLAAFMQKNHIEKNGINCIISSVVPELTGVLRAAAEELAGRNDGILTLNNRLDTGLCLKIKAPEMLGADRLANAAGAYGFFRKAVAVVDFGTATTVTLVDSGANLLGGAIMPGIGLMGAALAERTAQLCETLPAPPGSPVGRDTAECIRSGLFYGTAGAVERIIGESERETGVLFHTVLTGGHSAGMKSFMSRTADIMPHLIFEGMRLVHEKNRSK